jgi:hypothetical protein
MPVLPGGRVPLKPVHVAPLQILLKKRIESLEAEGRTGDGGDNVEVSTASGRVFRNLSPGAVGHPPGLVKAGITGLTSLCAGVGPADRGPVSWAPLTPC